MADSHWSLSSSSEDDEDAHFFQSNIREGSVYYEKFLKEDYGTDVWEDHIPRFKNLGLNNNHNNHSSSFANISTNLNGQQMANALHLSCTVPDRVMVLNLDTNQYEVMRYVEMANGAVIPPKAEDNLPDSTMNGSTASTSTYAPSLNNSFNPLMSPSWPPKVNEITKPKQKTHKTKLIPLETVDFIDAPKDPRKPKPDPEDLMELPFISFHHSLEWNGEKWIPARFPKPDKSYGFKPSLSYERKKRLDQLNRHQKLRDPRLQKDLFPSPKRVDAHTSKDDKHDTVSGLNIFGSDSDSSLTDPPASIRSPAFSAFNPESSGFAAKLNSTVLPGSGSNSDSTSSDIGLSDSDTFEENTTRKLRSRKRKNNKKHKDKSEDKENEKVPPLVIKLPKGINSIEHGHSSRLKPPKKKENKNIIPPKLLTPPEGVDDLRNEMIATMQREFPDDVELSNMKQNQTTAKCDEAVPTQITESINQTNDTAANVAETSVGATLQPKNNEVDTKDDTNNGLDAISDDETMIEQPEMVSHGNLTDLEDVSMDESDDMLDEVVKNFLGNDNVEHQPNTSGSLDIEKSLALFDNESVDRNEIDRFIEGISTEGNVATPNSPQSTDRHELIKILDPNSSGDYTVNATDPVESVLENMQTEHEREADTFDVPEIGATADVGAAVDETAVTVSDQLNFLDVNSFGRPRNIGPDSADETYRPTITIQLFEFELAEIELEKQESQPQQQQQQPEEAPDHKDENDEMQGDSNLVDTSEDDQEYDHPITSDNNFVVPNSNTDRRVTQTNLKCTLCPYKDPVGWKKLTKHYIRKHPDTEIAHSRLAERFKLDEIIANPISSTITGAMLTKSICLFCDQCYCLDSSKWEKHFISHTGECPFKCQKCGSKLFDNLHKRCNSQENILINGPHEFKENKLYGYVCKLCNFVQLDKKNIFNHIDKQHQAMQIEESVAEIYLINVTETASALSNTDDIILVEECSDDDDDDEEKPKPIPNNKKHKRKIPSDESSLNMSDNVVDLTQSDNDAD